MSRELGARCDDRTECEDRCLPPVDYPGGFCTASCERPTDCLSESACADLEGGVCLFRCNEPADCAFLGLDWTCSSVAARGMDDVEVSVCVPS